MSRLGIKIEEIDFETFKEKVLGNSVRKKDFDNIKPEEKNEDENL